MTAKPPKVWKLHSFKLQIRTRTITLDGTADVYGEGTRQEVQAYLLAALNQSKKTSPLRLRRVDVMVVGVEQ